MNISTYDWDRIEERVAIQTEGQHRVPSLEPDRYSVSGSVPLGDQEYSWEVWDGHDLGKHVAIDTETTLLEDPSRIPQLCLISISDGQQHFLAKPDQLAELMLKLQPDCHLIFHNVAFDFWVMDQQLCREREDQARNVLWAAVDSPKRVHDTMLLAALVTLAQSDDDRMLTLDDACQQWLGYGLAKDEYRLRFVETLGKRWHDLESGFLRYAVCDAIATWQLYSRLTKEADRITKQHNLSRQFGFFTEGLQVKAAITLQAITRNGLHIDLDRAEQLKQQIDANIQLSIKDMQDIDANLFHRFKKTGKYKIGDNGLPKINQTVLAEKFSKIAQDHELEIPSTASGKITTSVNTCWCQYRELDPLVEAYCSYIEQTKLRTFFDGLQQPRIHPKYRTLVRSGRTSCYGPNIQQLPAGSPIREAITARPGNLLFVIDYNSLELRTLATVCHQQIGFSRLRDVLIEGTDPHSYAAAMFAGVSLGEFEQLPNRKQLRQQAKVFNFGLPAGFGAAALVDHAKFSYGVELTLEDAERFIEKLTREVYPELGLYLQEDTHAILAAALNADPVQVRATWSQDWQLGMLRKVLAGNPCKRDGTPYKPHVVDRVWKQLEKLCGNDALRPYLLNRDTSETSPLRKLMWDKVTTITGRMRGGVPFTAARNSPFQGLAADGAKLAMWNLIKAGYRVVAFVHDEFVIELNKIDYVDQAVEEIPRICSDSMQPFVPGIPVPCEFALTRCWSKKAEAVWDEAGRLQVWEAA